MSNPKPGPIDDRGPALQGITITLLVLAVTSFSMRAYVRTYMIKSFGLDDWLMAAATGMYLIFAACVLSGIRYGTGRHFSDLNESDAQRALEFWFFCYLTYCWTLILAKLSIGIFLLRLVGQRAYVWLLYTIMILSSLTGLAFFFVTTFQCRPISYFWNKELTNGTCISMDIIIALTYLYSSLTILCDFTFALLPIAIIRKLNMPVRLKVATIPLLTMGCVASGAVVVRLAYVETFRDPDFLYATVEIAIWSTMEAGLAITAGSFACTRPLIIAVLHRLNLPTLGGNHQRNSHNILNDQSPLPRTIGSNPVRRQDMFALDNLAHYSDHKNTGSDTMESLPMRHQSQLSVDYFSSGERRMNDTVDAGTREVKTGSWYVD